MGFVEEKMPVKQPGTLTEEQAAAVTAWILSENKATSRRSSMRRSRVSDVPHAEAEAARSGAGSATK